MVAIGKTSANVSSNEPENSDSGDSTVSDKKKIDGSKVDRGFQTIELLRKI